MGSATWLEKSGATMVTQKTLDYLRECDAKEFRRRDKKIIASAYAAGVVMKCYGSQPNWAWDYPGLAGGCGMASELDAAQDALEEIARQMERKPA
jgi:hypothetical protein